MLLIAESNDPGIDEIDLNSLLRIDDPTLNDPPEPPDTMAAQISLHALTGHIIPQTLKVLDHINSSAIAILVDSGSTHNFIQARIAKFLGLQVTPAQSFHVLVGNGEELACSSICKQVPLQLGSHTFLVDLFLLPLSGAEVVLGVQWLTTLGPVLTDYEQLTMKFIREGKLVELKGQQRTTPQEATIHQIKRMVSTDGVAEYFQLQLLSSTKESPTPSSWVPEIEELLKNYSQLFEEPRGLPLIRETDHHIPLLKGSNPVNVRPYKYPHFQKHEIECQIKEMLAKGIIQRSNSAFSSPVLLVRKKDESWRFCVDYRALNVFYSKRSISHSIN